jgi:hypothetical protein
MEEELMRRPERGALHAEKIARTGLYISVEFHFGDSDRWRDFNSHLFLPPKPEGPKSGFQSYTSNADGLNVFTEVDFDVETLSFVACFCD